jgi:hypothetical protein
MMERKSGMMIDRGFGNFLLAKKFVTGNNSIASRIANSIGRIIPFA